MKKLHQLLNAKGFLKSLAAILICTAVQLLYGSVAFGQAQTIGSFPSMEGSFENTTAAQQTAVTVTAGTQLTSWTGANLANSTPSISTSTVRTGGKALQWVTGSTSGVLFSNTAASTAIANTTSYVVQFYWWKGFSGSARAFGTQIGPNGTTNLGSSVSSGTLGAAAVSTVWTKAAVVVTSGTDATATRYGLVQFKPSGGSFATPGYTIDDFVVYAGSSADVTAPTAASSASATATSGTAIDVTWTGTANAGDGGGYVIVRSTSATAVTLNANGIYGVGNTSATGGGTIVGIVAGVTGTNTFSNTGLTSGTTYYYSVFAVDKAFNYAAAATANATPQSCAAPSIGTQPSTTPQNLCLNDAATGFSVSATGTGTVSYQWQSSTVSNFSSGVSNVGTNLDNYTPLTNSAGTLYYRCVVTNDCGAGSTNTATSNISGAVAVLAAPAISSQSTAGATYPEGFGSAAPLTVTATGAGLTYQWYDNGTTPTNSGGTSVGAANGGQTNSFTPPTATIGTNYYYCIVSGTCPSPVTSAVSGAIVIDVSCTAPSFFDQPVDFQNECVGGTLTLGTVTADQSPTFQWYIVGTKTNTGGTAVTLGSGGTTDTYTPPSDVAGTFFYYCVATSGACTTATDPVEITIDATAITGQSTAAANYTVGATATALTVTATGQDIAYQWYSNTTASNTGGTLIGGATGFSYTPPTASLGTTYYYCVVTGTCDPTAVTSAVSGAITIVQYATGDFMSKASASWEVATTWNTWNGSAWVASAVIPNSATASVYISGGFNVTYPTTDRAVKNLYVLDGSLKTGTVINGANRRYIFVHGTTIEVGTSGTLGSALTGDNADAICIDLRNTGTVTFTGSGGLANFGLIRYNNTQNVIIDRDITLNYHGSAFAGNAMAYFSNIAVATNDNALTINAGKTLTFAPWACYSATGSSGQLGTVNMSIIVNGTLTMQPFGSAYTPPKGYLNMGVTGAGKTFLVNIGSTGVMNLQEFLPNSTGAGTGNTGTVNIASGGVLNVANETDLRDNNTISGAGTFNVLSGSSLKIGNAAGITASGATGAIQTDTRSFSSGASYSYEGTVAQTTGDGLPASVNNMTVNNAAGVTLTNNVSVAGALTLTSGALTTGANTVTALASVARTSGRVNGKLERAVAAGASTVEFAIGDAANYTPVSLAFGAGNAAGNVTASTTVPNAAPAAGNVPTGSGISQSKYINRNWTLTTTIPSPDYTATFTYINPGDVVGSANTNALLVGKDNGGTWANASGTSVSPTVTTASGLTSFGTFSLGETNCIVPTGLTYTNNTITYCANSAITTNSPSFTGDAATSYSVSPALPTGLTLNTSTGEITGMPTVATAAADYTVTVNNACGSTTKDVNITVNAVTAITAAAAPVSQTKFINSAATNITVGAAGASLTYQWFSNASNSNVGGTSVGASNGGQTNTYTPATNTLGTLYYYCEITGACGNASSAAVAVTVTNTNTWAGGGSSDWSTGANWTSGVAPTGANDAVIPNGNTPYPALSASSAINDLTIDAGATVDINGFTFTITGAVTGTGTLSGSATSNVTTSATTTLRFTPGANTLKNLNVTAGTTTLGNAVNITAGTALNTYGTVTVANGATLASNGNLNIKSNQFGTARVAANTSGVNYITGDVTVERYIPQNASRSWRLLSVPTKGTKTIKQTWQENQAAGANGLPGFGTQITANLATLPIIQAAGFDAFSQTPSAMSYNSGTQAWTYLTSTNSAPIETNKGYFLYIRGSRAVGVSTSTGTVDATVLRTTGTLYQGDNNTAISIAAGKFEPVGNTYASAIDFTSLSKTGTLSNSFYVWDSKLLSGSTLGAYQTFVGALGFTPATVGGSYPTGVPNTTIESGEAIMLGAPAGGGGTIKLVEAAKTTGNQLNPFRPSAQPAQFRTSLYKSGTTPVLADNNIVVFDNAYSNAADADDALKIAHGGENIDIVTEGKSLIVDARQPVTERDVIQYSLKNLAAQQYKLSFSTINMNTAGLTAFVEDKYLHTTTAIDLNSASEYSFTVEAGNAASSAADRLSIVFKKAVVAPVSEVKPAITVSPNPVENGMMRLSFAKQVAGKYTIRLLNTNGQAVFTNTVIHSGGNSAHIQNIPASLAAGTYRLEVIAPDKARSGQSVFINNK